VLFQGSVPTIGCASGAVKPQALAHHIVFIVFYLNNLRHHSCPRLQNRPISARKDLPRLSKAHVDAKPRQKRTIARRHGLQRKQSKQAALRNRQKVPLHLR